MPEARAAWGIDIGQAGLKAIRLKYAEAAGQVLAVAFDYVPHPKILSQPDAIPDELINQALERFLSRNDVRGDSVSISVPGQTALTRFIQLPPVESAKVAEIVKYEARQQIPFALEDVCWQWQRLGGGVEESGYMLEAEVGLFAMKRDQVMQHLRPFNNHGVEVDVVQIAPLALYNFLAYDQMGVRPDSESVAKDEHTIVLDMGADNTTLMVSNGQKIWIRNVPIGGNHFTRALTKEMKLTFAKAEHLKINATKSPDPRAVFQALRPVFNDYVSEIQRSIGYFSSVNRNAKIGKVIGLGNGFKLAGLQKFLQQNLQHEVVRIDSFQALVGDSVLRAKMFEENLLSFAVPYGLALQGLGLTRVHVDLLPEEIRTQRIIREKKPWAVTAAAALLFFLAISVTGYARMAKSVSNEHGKSQFGVSWEEAVEKAKNVTSTASSHDSAYKQEESQFEGQSKVDEQLVRTDRGREEFLEMEKAWVECLPRDTDAELAFFLFDANNNGSLQPAEIDAMPEKMQEWLRTRMADRKTPKEAGLAKADFEKYYPDMAGSNAVPSDLLTNPVNNARLMSRRNRVRIYRTKLTKLPDLSVWYNAVQSSKQGIESYLRPEDKANPPEGPGFIVTLYLVHYHNELDETGSVISDRHGANYVRETFVANLKKWSIAHNDPTPTGRVPVRGIGITHPLIVQEENPETFEYVIDQRERRKVDEKDQSFNRPRPNAGLAEGGGYRLGKRGGKKSSPEFQRTESKDPNLIELKITHCVVQFVWKPMPQEKRYIFDALYDYFQTAPEADWTDLEKAKASVAKALEDVEKAQGLELTQEQFDEFVKHHFGKAAPAEAAAEPAT